MAIEIVLNGHRRRLDVVPGESLLDALRDRCGILSLKDGCQPQGECGCCLAIVGNGPRVTCTLPATAADGKEVLTLEGVSAGEREALARAFQAAGAVQCGFCIPGFIMSGVKLLDEVSHPTREEIRQALSGNLCRCTGYGRIVEAIELAAGSEGGD